MKLIVALLFTLISLTSKSQSYNADDQPAGVAMGLSGGYSSKQTIIGT